MSDNLKVFERMTATLLAMYKRKHLNGGDQGMLSEISRRPDGEQELAELEAFRVKVGRYFPQSIGRLLAAWDDTLDRARASFKDPNKPQSLRDKVADARLKEDARAAGLEPPA